MIHSHLNKYKYSEVSSHLLDTVVLLDPDNQTILWLSIESDGKCSVINLYIRTTNCPLRIAIGVLLLKVTTIGKYFSMNNKKARNSLSREQVFDTDR